MDFEFLYPTCCYYLSNLFGCSILLSLALSFYVKGSSLFMGTAVFDNNKENIFFCVPFNKQVKYESLGNGGYIITSKTASKIPVMSGHKEKFASVPGHLLLSLENAAVPPTVRPTLSGHFMYPNLVLKSPFV